MDAIDKKPDGEIEKCTKTSREESEEHSNYFKRKPKRLAALNQRAKLKELLSCLRTESKSKPKPLAHDATQLNITRSVLNGRKKTGVFYLHHNTYS